MEFRETYPLPQQTVCNCTVNTCGGGGGMCCTGGGGCVGGGCVGGGCLGIVCTGAGGGGGLEGMFLVKILKWTFVRIPNIRGFECSRNQKDRYVKCVTGQGRCCSHC